ncbi:hypothetical protein QJS66_13845 [Kocuria rhizophila]|nr:hypothetical protein QJS66_13845 [Kocuria rhizophila]
MMTFYAALEHIGRLPAGRPARVRRARGSRWLARWARTAPSACSGAGRSAETSGPARRLQAQQHDVAAELARAGWPWWAPARTNHPASPATWRG